MINRIISASLLAGAGALAVFLFQQHYAAPSCSADTVTALATHQVSAELGHSGFTVTDIRETSGGLFSRVRQCRMDVAPLIGLQAFDKAHWMRVLYSDIRDGKTDAVTVVAHVAGPTNADLTANG